MTAHRYWRMNITAVAGGSYVQFCELEMHTSFGGSQACSGGTAIEGTHYSTYDSSKLFDGNTTTYYENTGTTAWVGYDFGAGNTVSILEIKAYSYSTANRTPDSFDIQFSDNGSSWTTAWSVTSAATGWSVSTWKTFSGPIVGDLSITEAPDTFTATGSVAVDGSLAVTEAPDTFAATGTIVMAAISGSMAVTEAHDTFAASGSVIAVISGDMAVTEEPDVFLAFEGTHTYQTLSGDLSDGIRIGSSASMIGFKGGTLLSAIGIQSHISTNWSQAAIIEEIVRLQHTLSAGSRYNVLVRDHALIRDALLSTMPVTLHETIGVHATTRAVLGVLIVDGLRLRSALSGSAHYYKVIAEGVRLNAALGRFVGASLSQGIGIHAALSRVHVSRPVMTEGVTIASVLGRSLLFSCTMQEGVDLREHDVLNAIYNQTISEDVQINASYIEPSGSVTTWAVNMRTGAATEYENYKFNSFAKMGNKYIGASQDGLYELDGDTDDGAQIIADIAGGFAQFGESHFASLKAVYLGVRGRGNFIFRLVEGDGTTRDYAVSANDMRTTRIDLGKGLRTRYWAYELISTGQDFDLDSIEFVPIVLQRRV